MLINISFFSIWKTLILKTTLALAAWACFWNKIIIIESEVGVWENIIFAFESQNSELSD